MQDVNWDALPEPEDDGAADHLRGAMLADVPLPSTDGADVSLAMQTGRVVVFCYPMTGEPDRDPPQGWSEVPGARGCTPQACAYRDLQETLAAVGVARVFGVSTQSTSAQTEAKTRLGLPYTLLSDHALGFAEATALPTFERDGRVFLRRLTMIVEDGTIAHVRYPVFPPDSDPSWVIETLSGADQPRPR